MSNFVKKHGKELLSRKEKSSGWWTKGIKIPSNKDSMGDTDRERYYSGVDRVQTGSIFSYPVTPLLEVKTHTNKKYPKLVKSLSKGYKKLS